jgi:guanylate kinase
VSKGKPKGALFIICGPSGSGKTTLAEGLLKSRALKGKLVKSRSLTTRPKRSAETNKKDYFFISAADFQQRLRQKKILEWTKYLGYYYGTPKSFIERQLGKGKYVVLCLDLKGADCLKRLYPDNSVTIFVLPPSLKEARRRIEQRCSRATPAEINRRLGLAKKELLLARKYDYRLVNKNFAQALKRLRQIVFRIIRQKRGR